MTADLLKDNAIMRMNEGRPEAALVLIDKAIKLDPANVQLYKNKCLFLRVLGKHEEVRAVMQMEVLSMERRTRLVLYISRCDKSLFL